MDIKKLSRRDVLKGTAAGAGLIATGGFRPSPRTPSRTLRYRSVAAAS
ncbi:MAG: twin-arginine translocation signal domain-containing protein [Devosia sp.]|nr:twin-arginine translocation signal domain-containing protein [Devosia sp.]